MAAVLEQVSIFFHIKRFFSSKARGPLLCFIISGLLTHLKKKQKNFINVVPMGFLPEELWIAFPRKSQLRQSHNPTKGPCWVFDVSIVHQTVTWTEGSLTCTQM